MWQSVEILNVFNIATLKQIFWKMKTFIKKLETCLLVEKTKTESALFPYKTAVSKANLKTNRIMTEQIGPITENGVLPVDTLFFWKFSFSLRISHKDMFWCTIDPNVMTNDPNVHIHTFRKGWSFIWRWFFSVSILNIKISLSFIDKEISSTIIFPLSYLSYYLY